MEIPNKVYLEVVPHSKPKSVYEDVIKIERTLKGDVEYTRTDAFTEKTCEWLKENAYLYVNDYTGSLNEDMLIEDFKEYLKK